MAPIGSVRAGVVGGGTGAIPDSVVDNFEAADADPAGVYESGETIADYYAGDTGVFSRTTNNVEEAATALQRDTAAPAGLVSEPGDGLNRYPEEGETIGFLLANGANVAPGCIHNGEIASGDISGYATYVQSGDFRIFRFDGGWGNDTVLTSQSISVGDEWLWAETDLPTSQNDTIEARLYELDADLQRGTQIASISTNDSNYVDNRGVGVYTRSGTGTGTILDWVRVLG